MSLSPLRIGIAGLGVVGSATASLLQRNTALLAQRCGRPLELVAVSSRERGRDRGMDLSGVAWEDDAEALAARPDLHVVVETIGGADGIARRVVETALQAGRHVVTANKALLAHHGNELAALAEARGVALLFEAAVAGGIPILKTIREGLAGNRIDRVEGILNGTSNFILTEMRLRGAGFADTLAEAQRLGYAEADPSFDVDGIDTAHKLSLLAALAFGRQVDFAGVAVEGIRGIEPVDIACAEQLGCRIKLLAVARRTDDGIEQRVGPCLVRHDAPVAAAEGVFNAVAASGDAAGTTLMVGRGAGGEPTASAVVADLCDVARGHIPRAFGLPVADLSPPGRADPAAASGAYYLRFRARDPGGMIAAVSAIFRDEGVSFESEPRPAPGGADVPGSPVTIMMTTQQTTESAMRRGLSRIEGLPAVAETPCLMRLEGF